MAVASITLRALRNCDGVAIATACTATCADTASLAPPVRSNFLRNTAAGGGAIAVLAGGALMLDQAWWAPGGGRGGRAVRGGGRCCVRYSVASHGARSQLRDQALPGLPAPLPTSWPRAHHHHHHHQPLPRPPASTPPSPSTSTYAHSCRSSIPARLLGRSLLTTTTWSAPQPA